MTRYVFRQLTLKELKTREGMRFEGRVIRVEVEQVTNKWKYTVNTEGKLVRQQEIVPVVTLDEGDGIPMQWIPNQRCRRALIDAWGRDTDLWVGRRLAVYVLVVAREDKRSGREKEAEEKFVEPL